MRPFQIVLIAIFAALAVGGLIFMTMYRGGSSEENPYGESVVIWGTFDREIFAEILKEVTDIDELFEVVTYREKDPATFDVDLVNAIAEGRSPDMIFIQHDKLLKHRAKLYPISYETIPLRTIKDTYIDGAEIFARTNGLYGIPIAVDPMVAYWNRDIFSTSGIAAAPKTWEELVSVTSPAVTRKNTSLDVLQSTVAFGEYNNIRYAKEVLSMLLLQSGSTLVEESAASSGKINYEITIDKSAGASASPASAALSFYTQFALPTHSLYSWNRALDQDHYQFLAGELGLYFAPGSIFNDLKKENPNLNFDIAAIPQGSNATIHRNFGRFYAFAIPRASRNLSGAFLAAWKLGDEQVAAELANRLHLAPVHRNEIARGTGGDQYREVLYSTALISRGWLDPDPVESSVAFKKMIEAVTSGRLRVSDSVEDAVKRLRLLF